MSTISVHTIYDRNTDKHSLLVDTELLDKLRVDLYKNNRTKTTALELLDWLETCITANKQTINE